MFKCWFVGLGCWVDGLVWPCPPPNPLPGGWGGRAEGRSERRRALDACWRLGWVRSFVGFGDLFGF